MSSGPRVPVWSDYSLVPVDPDWLVKKVKAKRHIALEPDLCILCRACEDVCPWNAIWMVSPAAVNQDQGELVRHGEAEALFLIDDEACTRCGICVERCPSDALYFARFGEASARGR